MIDTNSEKRRILAKNVRDLCEELCIDFLFIVDGYSEWSVTKDGHLKDVINYHRDTENLNYS